MKSADDVVFVFPPAHGNLGAFRNHLGVSYLRAALKEAGISSSQYVNECPGAIDAVAVDILSKRAKVVGFTVYDANFPLSLALAKSIKVHSPRMRVVFGGPTATFGADNILSRHREVDYCIRGETEETGPQIIRTLIDGKEEDCDALPHISSSRNIAIVSTSLPPLSGCTGKGRTLLDSVPSPYLTGTLTDGRTGVLTGRGCTHHCQYCCFAALGRKRLRVHSVERVLSELEYIAAHQRRTQERYMVSIHDDAFTLLPDRAKRLCQAIADRNFGLVLACITRADKVDDELLRIMREAGFVSLAFGLESAVPAVLRATGKVRPPDWPDPDLTPEEDFVAQVHDSVKAAKKYGFNVGVSVILGLPGEREEDGSSTLRFVDELPIDYYMHNFLWVFPGTPLWKSHRRYGIETEVNSLGLPATVKYAYDVTKLRPRAKCSLEEDARLVRLPAAYSLFSCDSFSGTPGRVSTVVVHADTLTPQTADWLSEILDVGGLVIQVYSSLKRSRQDDLLYRDRTTLSEFLVPARHHVQAIPRPSRRSDHRWMLASAGVDFYCSHKPRLLSFEASVDAKPLVDWANGIPVHGDLCDVAEYLQSPVALDQFIDRLNGDSIGHHMRKMPIPPGLVYPGRWMRGSAPCRAFARIEIDENGDVRCCRQGPNIGRIGDPIELLMTNLETLAREAEQQRGCDACPSTHCPRCPFPGIDPETYCSIMRRQEKVLDLLNVVQLYSKLPLVFEMQRDRAGSN